MAEVPDVSPFQFFADEAWDNLPHDQRPQAGASREQVRLIAAAVARRHLEETVPRMHFEWVRRRVFDAYERMQLVEFQLESQETKRFKVWAESTALQKNRKRFMRLYLNEVYQISKEEMRVREARDDQTFLRCRWQTETLDIRSKREHMQPGASNAIPPTKWVEEWSRLVTSALLLRNMIIRGPVPGSGQWTQDDLEPVPHLLLTQPY